MSGSKLGKGGGRGTGRMVVAPPPPLGRGMAMPMRRQVMGPKQKGTGMGKGRLGSAGGSGLAFVAPSQEESFQVLSLDQGRAPFAMAIRLTPEVLEDLKRAEAEDVKCEMKFGITPSGHVIKVGSEEYKFSSAPEPGDLCDIYEEQQHGEDGNGVLKEAGSVWRKLSVLRILNASEKDRVKNRSKEAERQQKSRKAIILDPTHSLLKNQGGASGDVNGRRVPVKPKKELPKKMQKAPTSSPVVSVTKPKPVMTTASLLGAARVAKAASVASPELPPPIQPQTAIILPPKGRPVVEERDSIPAPMKASNVVQNINTPSPVTTTSDTAVATKVGGVISPIELRNSLITLLTDNPKGLTIKAVEKAFGESMPHVKPERKTIEKAIKAIASYHAPGKYMLREGVSFAKPSPGGGSLKEPSPYSHDAELISIRGDESPEQDMMETEGASLGKSKQGEELAIDSPEGEEKMANSGGSDSGSSSDSGSDTDSDSRSGSESHSGTRCAFAFENVSRSGSGSDSDSDGSSSSGNADENMDEDVEIVSEDEENGTPLKFKVSDKIPISHDSEEVDIVGDEAMGHIGTDSAEKAIVAVEVLDNNMEVDVDVLSVDGGIGSPQEWGSLSPPGLQRQQESLKGIGGSEDAKSKVKLVPIIDKSSADSDQSLGALVTKQNNIQGLEKKKDDIESSKQLVKGGKTQQADMDSRFAKSVEKEKDKAANLRGRGKDLGNRQLKRDMDSQGTNSYKEPGLVVRPGRDPKQARRQSLEPAVPQQNESLKKTDVWGKPMKDIDMAARTCNDGVAQNSSFRDGRKTETITQEPAKGMLKINNNDGGSKHNEKRATESSDLEVGELQETLKSRVSLGESAERPQEMRGLKRLAEDGDNQEPAARVYKKPSVTPVPPQLPVNCSVHSNTAPVSKLEKTSAVQDIAPRPPNAELNRGGPLDVLLNHAAPSSKASSAENGRKQWPYVKGQEFHEKEGFEQQSGQEPDRKPKISASVLAPGNKISALPDLGQSNGKWANLSGSCDGADEKDYFLMYEKNAPELRGPAVTYEQAEKYKREYEEKYIIYRRLYDDIEDTRLDFATFKREIERASNVPEKLQQVRSQIQITYHAVHKRSKRMQKTFNVLHDELLTIKQHLKDFAEKAGQG
ncbi:unnamed protein product [Sphagnum troendelagicum]|uniref:OCEL domain-containing protein n=1 Tax=Sphagnum troendelagicum TaxID=128251 RepID=A0ABP0TIZ0_9BRYO